MSLLESILRILILILAPGAVVLTALVWGANHAPFLLAAALFIAAGVIGARLGGVRR